MPEIATDSATTAATSATDTTQTAETSQQQTTDTSQQTAETTQQTTASTNDWPEDWRAKYAGTDEKKLKKLERYGSPQAALDALFNAQAKIASGELKTPLKADATPEEKAAWRAEQGLPASPKDYDLTLPDGLIVGETDRPLVDDFLTAAHEGDMKPAEVQKVLGWYFAKQQAMVEAQADADVEFRAQANETLREEYGPGYKQEVKIALAAFDNAPDGVKDLVLGGRLADGTLLGDNPAILSWLNRMSRELNPIGTVVPGSGTNAVQAVEAEVAALRAKMGDHKSDYWKGPTAAKLQARNRDLTTALQKGR
jgi:hypothetical protein